MYRSDKICIDSCVWVKYAGYSKTYLLADYIDRFNLEVFADRYLLVEIHDALIDKFQFTLKEADYIIRQITPFLTISAPRNIYRISPDAKDNYLYDLCIQNNCEVLITIDKLILKDNMAPFVRKTDAWLKKLK
jgi:predicted nucleic acid-binding protein